MERYKNLWKWMFLPMIIMQLGIFRDYWGDFSDNPWSVHIHYWTGTAWYLYLIIQPYYATHGQLERHRTNGIIGIFLAGGVALTALSMMHGDILTIERSMANPERFGPFKPWFFYGVMAIEIPMILAFAFAVIQAILKRKQLHDHAWWLVSTVFIIMFPALGRGFGFVQIITNLDIWPNFKIMNSQYLALSVIILLTLLAALKYRKLKHPATWLAVGINIYALFLEPLGKSNIVQSLMNTIVK